MFFKNNQGWCSDLLKQIDQFRTGLILIGIGAAALVFQSMEGGYSALFMMVLGIGLLGFHRYGKKAGFLIPGSLLLGLGIGKGAYLYVWGIGNPFIFGLGIGFLLIYVFTKLWTGEEQWWPLIPGFSFLGLDVLTKFRDLLYVISQQWPLAIIVIGGYFLYVSRQSNQKSKR